MKDNTEKYLIHLTKKVFEEASTEQPSFNFTNAVMLQINELNKNNAITYKPLISKTVWFLIFVAFLAAIFFIIQNNDSNSAGWFQTINYSIIYNNPLINSLLNTTLPKTVMYGVLLFGIMFCIQIPLLHRRFNQTLKH